MYSYIVKLWFPTVSGVAIQGEYYGGPFESVTMVEEFMDSQQGWEDFEILWLNSPTNIKEWVS